MNNSKISKLFHQQELIDSAKERAKQTTLEQIVSCKYSPSDEAMLFSENFRNEMMKIMDSVKEIKGN